MKTITIVAIIAAVAIVGAACIGIPLSGVLNGGTTGPGGDDPVVPTDPVDPTPTETPTETPTQTPTDSSMSYFSPMTSSGSSSSSSGSGSSSTTPACEHNWDIWSAIDGDKHKRICTLCLAEQTDGCTYDYTYTGSADTKTHSKRCDTCGRYVKTEECAPSEKYSYDADAAENAPTHSKKCVYCEAKVDTADCTFDEENNGWTHVKNTNSHSRTCTEPDCGHEYIATCTPEVDEADAVFKQIGETDFHTVIGTCTTCKNEYDGEEEIPCGYQHSSLGSGKHKVICGSCPNVIVDEEECSSFEYSSIDSNKHKKTCIDCGGHTEVEHTLPDTYTYDLTSSNPTMSKACSDKCGYAEVTPIVAAIGGVGYKTFAEAVTTAATGNQEITLLVDMTEKYTVTDGTKVIINPNNKKAHLTYENITDIQLKVGLGENSKVNVTSSTVGADELVVSFSENGDMLVADYAISDAEMYICTADGLVAFGKILTETTTDSKPGEGILSGASTVTLKNDINLEGYEWTPINLFDSENLNTLTIDGQGNTISNMKIEGDEKLGFIGQNARDLTIKDLTFDKADVSSTSRFVGVVIGYQYGDVVLEKVNVTNSEVKTTQEGENRIGGLIGFSLLHDGATLKVIGCTVDTVKVSGYQNVAGLVGSLYNYDELTDKWTLSGNTVKNCVFTVTSGNVKDGSAFAVESKDAIHTYEASNEYFMSEEHGSNVAENNEAKIYIPISNADELFAFAKSVNEDGKTYEGLTVKLMADIDLENKEWTPIGQTTTQKYFFGTFDGMNHIISNLNVDMTTNSEEYIGAGLFGFSNCRGSIKNVTIDHATIKGTYYAGALIGYMGNEQGLASVSIENCHVTNSEISAAGGDAIGSLVGLINQNIQIKTCSATKCTVTKTAAEGITSWGVGQVVGTVINGNSNIDAINAQLTATEVSVYDDGTLKADAGLVGLAT